MKASGCGGNYNTLIVTTSNFNFYVRTIKRKDAFR